MATHPTQTEQNTPLEAAIAPLPPLETGDALTRPEFERRYEAMPRLKKAELIHGVVYVGSPVSDLHAGAHGNLTTLFIVYAAGTPGTAARADATVRLDLENELQPDALLRRVTGGQSRVDKYIEGPPELVAEVASSSVSRDLHSKLAVYRRHGVREYVVWRLLDRAIDWFVLHDGDYQRHAADDRGVFRSREFPGLSLDGPALLRGDMSAALAVLHAGLASGEHAEFVRGLAAQS
jgi:Uma2 family endonuclease